MRLHPFSFQSPRGFSPVQLPGLQLWLDADDNTTVLKAGDAPAGDTETVDRWLDKSGNGNDVEKATGNRPKYSTDALNGKAVVYFSGLASEDLRKSDPVNMTGNGTYTFYIVLNRDFTTSNRDAFVLRASTAPALAYRMRFVATSSTVHWLSWADSAVTSTRSWGAEVGTYYVRKATYDGANQRWYYTGNNDTDALTGNVVIGDDPILYVGDTPDAGSYIGGMAEILFWNRLLSDDEQTAVEAYLNTKWGV